jgi:predicted hydrolase (HD superfamily)|tara:strand:- start:368 stop:859 length:492 start_codon:yes stop_codon:yes gene_type:complete
MKKLTIDAAKEIQKKYLEKIKDDKLKKFVKIHSKLVGEMAIILSNKNKLNEFFRIAALVHDIGYSFDEAEHAKHSLRIIREEDFQVSEELKDCILNHGNNDFPSTEEGKIFRLADKLSALDKDFVSFFLEHNKDKIEEEDLSFIKMFLDKSFGYLKEFNIKKD